MLNPIEEEEEEDGKKYCAGEICCVCSFTFPAENHERFVEGFANQNSSQGLRKLDQRYSLGYSRRRHLLVISSPLFYLYVFDAPVFIIVDVVVRNEIFDFAVMICSDLNYLIGISQIRIESALILGLNLLREREKSFE